MLTQTYKTSRGNETHYDKHGYNESTSPCKTPIDHSTQTKKFRLDRKYALI